MFSWKYFPCHDTPTLNKVKSLIHPVFSLTQKNECRPERKIAPEQGQTDTLEHQHVYLFSLHFLTGVFVQIYR